MVTLSLFFNIIVQLDLDQNEHEHGPTQVSLDFLMKWNVCGALLANVMFVVQIQCNVIKHYQNYSQLCYCAMHMTNDIETDYTS